MIAYIYVSIMVIHHTFVDSVIYERNRQSSMLDLSKDIVLLYKIIFMKILPTTMLEFWWPTNVLSLMSRLKL